jgi:hypothetical protein
MLSREITEHLLHFVDLGVSEPDELSARTMEVISAVASFPLLLFNLLSLNACRDDLVPD